MPTAATFVPHDLDPSDFAQLEPLYRELHDRSVDSADDLRQWLVDFTELEEVVDEFGSRLHIAHTCHTDDEDIEKAYVFWLEQIAPKLKPWYDRLHRKLLASPARDELNDPAVDLLAKRWRADVDLYREKNIPLQTEEDKLTLKYNKACGEQMVEFRGETLTLQQLGRYLEETDRDTRKEAFELAANRRLQDRDKFDDIFEQLVKLRHQMALNADKPDFRGYIWQAKKRFDYTPDDCLAFGDAVAELVVPFNEKLHGDRKREMGLEKLRPWDTAVDEKGRPPLRPFDQKDVPSLVSKTRAMFHRVAPVLGEQFDRLKLGPNLDLDSRKGKAPGGYQAGLERTKLPFIFMNAAGLQRDVETLLHEGGHAFHFLEACEHVPLVFVRHAPIEFCEVASMGMELLAADCYDAFYDEANAARAKRQALEGAVRTLAWIALIDGFQHWIYTHPDHTRQQRYGTWIEMFERFQGRGVDWSGYEDAKAARWQVQLHLFQVPFYYIEYGIAQLGALRLWLNYRNDPDAAVQAYRRALALGGSRPLPELFEAAGLRFDFTHDTIAPLVEAVSEELERVPA